MTLKVSTATVTAIDCSVSSLATAGLLVLLLTETRMVANWAETAEYKSANSNFD